MRFEVNIGKKHVFFLAIFATILLIGVVYAVAPNPGHEATQIGPGVFKGDANSVWDFPGTVIVKKMLFGSDENAIWSFPGKMILQSSNPRMELYDNTPVSRWRTIVDAGNWRLDKSKDAGDFVEYTSPIFVNGQTNKITLQSPVNSPGFLEWSTKDGNRIASFTLVPGVNGGTPDVTFDLTPANQGDTFDLNLQRGQLSFTGSISASETIGSDRLCIKGACKDDWGLELGNLPPGAWCGWGLAPGDPDAIKCTGAQSKNPADGCPEVQGVAIFTRVKIGDLGWTCIKNQ